MLEIKMVGLKRFMTVVEYVVVVKIKTADTISGVFSSFL